MEAMLTSLALRCTGTDDYLQSSPNRRSSHQTQLQIAKRRARYRRHLFRKRAMVAIAFTLVLSTTFRETKTQWSFTR